MPEYIGKTDSLEGFIDFFIVHPGYLGNPCYFLN